MSNVSRSLISDTEAARRKARAIVSDILEYNRDKVASGLREDNLFEVLQAELEEGRAYYRQQVSPDLYARTNFYDRAIIDVLVKPMGWVQSEIW